MDATLVPESRGLVAPDILNKLISHKLPSQFEYVVSIFRDCTIGELFGSEELQALDADFARAGRHALSDDNISRFQIASYSKTLISDLVETDLMYERIRVGDLLFEYLGCVT